MPLQSCLLPATALAAEVGGPSGLRKTRRESNSLAHRTTWLRSDFPLCLSPFPYRHARSERGDDDGCRYSPVCSPQQALAAAARCLQNQRPDHRRNRHFATAFRSPGATALVGATSPGSPLPACHFSTTPDRRPSPFGFEFLRPLAAEIITRCPLLGSGSGIHGVASGLCSPPGP